MSIRAVKGFHDALPAEARRLTAIERASAAVLERYGFAEIRLPLLERTELFARSIGADTDIVEKEMYTFPDRDGTSLTLRPEGTASLVRAFVEHHLDQKDAVTRLYYVGPMFRHERPQKGRFRQFHQIGAELIGRDDPLADAEIVTCLVDLLQAIGIPAPRVLLNSLGDESDRAGYRDELRRFGEARLERLCVNCRRRLERNPLRILDCKEPGCVATVTDAPRLTDHLAEPARQHFARVRALLDAAGVAYELDSKLVRGLDYYARTTFEVTAPGLGAQGAIGAGGRYDGLVAQLGGPAQSAIGFACGVERLVLAVEAAREADPTAAASLDDGVPDAFIAPIGPEAEASALALARRARAAGGRLEVDGGRSLKSLMRRAGKLGAPYVLIVGEEELRVRRATLRDMRGQKDEPLSVDLDLSGPELVARLGVNRR